jgi:hypothetical protein
MNQARSGPKYKERLHAQTLPTLRDKRWRRFKVYSKASPHNQALDSWLMPCVFLSVWHLQLWWLYPACAPSNHTNVKFKQPLSPSCSCSTPTKVTSWTWKRPWTTWRYGVTPRVRGRISPMPKFELCTSISVYKVSPNGMILLRLELRVDVAGQTPANNRGTLRSIAGCGVKLRQATPPKEPEFSDLRHIRDLRFLYCESILIGKVLNIAPNLHSPEQRRYGVWQFSSLFSNTTSTTLETATYNFKLYLRPIGIRPSGMASSHFMYAGPGHNPACIALLPSRPLVACTPFTRRFSFHWDLLDIAWGYSHFIVF